MLPRDADALVVLSCGDTEVACWSLGNCGRPALAVVDELAQLTLVARRMGCSIRLRDASVELLEMLELVGLDEVVSDPAGVRPQPLRVEAGREPEGREQVGVEEVVVPDDPVA